MYNFELTVKFHEHEGRTWCVAEWNVAEEKTRTFSRRICTTKDAYLDAKFEICEILQDMQKQIKNPRYDDPDQQPLRSGLNE